MSSSKRRKYLLKFIATRDDYPQADGAKLEQESKVVEIAVKERIFVVPFNLQGYPITEAINLVGRAFHRMIIYYYFGFKSLLYPSAIEKIFVDIGGNRRLAATTYRNPTLLEPKLFEKRNHVRPLVWEILLEDRARMLPFVNFVVRTNKFR